MRTSAATLPAALALIAVVLPHAARAEAPDTHDVTIYGATVAGVAAAIEAKSHGHSVILIEPGKHVGGLTSGGLGATDIGNKAAIGGLAREFYRRLGKHYANDRAWKYGRREDYRVHRGRPDESEFWTFEPHVAERTLREMLDEAKVFTLLGVRLDRKDGVEKDGARIRAIRMEGGQRFKGTVFIDATYEGDLMAAAGVSYHVGREANAVYGETLNGVQTANARYHQFVKPVDPYVKPGDPSSGLLPGVVAGPPGKDGEGDKKVQAYCFRMCTTDVPENQREWVKPRGYDPLRYELLLRNFEAGDHRVPWAPTFMPNRKTDTNNNFAVSTDHIGANYDYPEGDYATRERIFRDHLAYQQGLLWTLANSPRVPEDVRKHFERLKPAKDEFVETDGWPHQLYIREARRMISDVVMTQHHCQGRTQVDDPVGLAAYTMDSHNIQRYVDADGHARNEGDVQVGGFPPYSISYRSIRPKQSECANLLVPVCLSASHIAYGSIRMEPVFMVLGQSSGAAAHLAIKASGDLQDVDQKQLGELLQNEGQILRWTAPAVIGLDPKKLPGLVVDDAQAEKKGEWLSSASVAGFVGPAYLHDNNESKGQKSATFRVKIAKTAEYDIRLSWTPNANRATNVPVTVRTSMQDQTFKINQREKPKDGAFQSLAKMSAEAGTEVVVTIETRGTDGHVIVDAVQLIESP
ncbi:MAG: FAD-dependent oxidoreductase [Planctomycetaceae bacterium]|nr:FAD-dependent oxidoreductase [Planctomycetaceae bacterium]